MPIMPHPGLPIPRPIYRSDSIQSIPRSVISASNSFGEFSPPRDRVRRMDGAVWESPNSVHSRNMSGESLLNQPSNRKASAASIPIFFGDLLQLPSEPQEELEETLTGVADLPPSPEPYSFYEDDPYVGSLLMNSPSVSTSTSDRPSSDSMRRLSTASGLTMESLSSASCNEPPTPLDNSFLMDPTDADIMTKSNHCAEPGCITHAPTDSSNATAHQRTGSEASVASAFTISEYYGSFDCSEDSTEAVLETLVIPLSHDQIQTPCAPTTYHSNQTITTTRRPKTPPRDVAQSPGATPRQTVLSRKLTFLEPDCKLEKENLWPLSIGTGGAPTHSFENSAPDDIQARQQGGFTSPFSQRPSDHIKAPSSVPSRRRAITPHTPLAIVVLPAETSDPQLTLDRDSVASSSQFTDSPSIGYSANSLQTKMYQIVQPDQFFPSNMIHPITPNSGDSYRPSTANQIPFQTLDKNVLHHRENSESPVGELFRTLQIWFDQEGFREIAPVFTYSGYDRQDDLLYFTTERVGYPFHYDSMQQVPVLRKVVAPDYEEAYALLEGKSQRNAGGRRDFISRRANLDMRTAGKYVVEDTEGKGGKWIWRLVYEVEERKSLMGRPMLGERAFIPITFACSPEILDPSHARKPTLLNSIIKNIGSKKTAIALDAEGRPTTRPRGKSLIGYHSRKRSDSAMRLLHTPPRPIYNQNPLTGDSTPSAGTTSSPRTSAQSTHDDELSRAQAHFFKTISPASTSRLRPMTAFDEDNGAKRNLRKAKTNEQLRRPFTADAARSAIPGRTLPPLPIVPVFGMAPQPSRATPTTVGNRFQARPKTADDRRPRTANKTPLDVQRIAAASFFIPSSTSPVGRSFEI